MYLLIKPSNSLNFSKITCSIDKLPSNAFSSNTFSLPLNAFSFSLPYISVLFNELHSFSLNAFSLPLNALPSLSDSFSLKSLILNLVATPFFPITRSRISFLFSSNLMFDIILLVEHCNSFASPLTVE